MHQAPIKALPRVFAAWHVTAPDAAKLAGTSERTWRRMRNGSWSGSLSQDQSMRASAVIGLYKRLHLYFGYDLADRWVKLPNRGPLFREKSPLAYMIDGGLPAIIATREYVDAIRGEM
jgi:uncharacterized protein (DUF2384 family)